MWLTIGRGLVCSLQLYWTIVPLFKSSLLSLFHILNIRSLFHGSMRFRFSPFSYLSTLHFSVNKSTFLRTYYLKNQCHQLTPPTSSSSSSSSSMLQLCKELQTLKKFHASLIVSNSFEPISISSKLISLYAQFNDVDSALSVFGVVQEPNIVVWNSIIKAHVDCRVSNSAFRLYRQMRNLGVEHDSFTFPILNRAVLLLQNSILYGGMVHCLAMTMGFQSDIYFCNTMIDVYVKCGYIDYACRLFVEMSHRDLVSWTSMISGYAYEGNTTGAFQLFHKMRLELEPGPVTVVVMLQLCCSRGSVIEGRQLHCYVIKRGFPIDGSLQNSILKMYTNSIADAEIFFSEIYKRDVVSWNILISLYISREDVMEVAKCFNKMQGELRPNVETLTLLMQRMGIFFKVKNFMVLQLKVGCMTMFCKPHLLDLYGKCGDLERSAQMFREIPYKNNITWSAMFAGLIEGGHFGEAADLFRQMQDTGLEPVAEILRSLVIMYTHMGAFKLGKGIHAFLIRNWFCSKEDDTPLETSILNMYVRCGSISSAKICFDKMVVRDLVTWTSMIEGCGAHGMGFEALKLFYQMMEEGVEPNNVTFLSLLSACSHSGLLSEGCGIFYSMKWSFGIEPDLNHYTCIVDLLGRSGKLKEALAIIMKLVTFPDGRIWGALFAASRVYGNHKLGEYAAQRLLELEPDNAVMFKLLLKGGLRLKRYGDCMKHNDLIKKPGWSCIEAKGLIHGFVSGDQSHPQMVEIYEIVEVLNRKIYEIG
ncbi:hypothetical protein HYC85_025682 [Camellia sinensis]|uniref:Uncharacterized protein n=1 Tax=Camellia sinensis TaxID=4442 RepID=A0A7J7GFQ0_CAMSI|nr:hypothetical protein HYC85_025682 [Camellia sinensis]